MVRGSVGGEATDYYLVRARAGQKLVVQAISRLKNTQVSVSQAEGDISLADERDCDQTRFEGRVPRTGDYLIRVNVHPCGEDYTLTVTVR